MLLEAGIEEADGFAAVSSGDNSNILSARVVRETFGVDNVVARIYDPRPRRGLRAARHPDRGDGALDRRPGAAPAAAGGFGAAVAGPVRIGPADGGPRRPQLGRSHRRARSRTPPAPGSPFLFRIGAGTVPKRSTVFQDGDLIYAAVADARLAEVEAILVAAKPECTAGGRSEMRVAIAGAGNVGRSIAAELVENGHEVLLIDKDPRAIKSESCREAEWLLADACELSSLEEAGLDTCDVAIAATGDDKANLVMSLLAKTEFGVPRTVGRVNHPKNEWLFTEVWGVDVSVSTPRLMSALVEEAVTVGDLVRLLTFHEGATNLVEMTLPASSPCVGQPDRRPALARRRGAGGDHPRRARPSAGRRRVAGGRRRTPVRHRAGLREGTCPDAVSARRLHRRLDDRHPQSRDLVVAGADALTPVTRSQNRRSGPVDRTRRAGILTRP